MSGKVYLVGAGPGDPELLTLKALRTLKIADIVMHDGLIAPEVLALVPSSARVQNVGKRCGSKAISQDEITQLLVQYALQGLTVVRLKSGDPLVFGRAGEEIEALRKADIDVEVVPGVTAALGAAAAVQIPLTHRRVSSAVLFLTGHHSEEKDSPGWPHQISPDATLVIYMPGHEYHTTSRRLLAAGVRPATPCAIISQATSSQQQVCRTTVGEMAKALRLATPTLLVVGDVVRFAADAVLDNSARHGFDLRHEAFLPTAVPAALAQNPEESQESAV
jgi:uroporphyrin-III C-methyltransferase